MYIASRQLDRYVVKVACCKSLTFDMATGKGILASWERNRRRAWISEAVAIISAVQGLSHNTDTMIARACVKSSRARDLK